MSKPSRGFIPKCPLFKPVGEGQSECLAERDGRRFIVHRYKNGNLVAWGAPNRGHFITKARKAGAMIPISTSRTRSMKHLLDEAASYLRRHDKPRA
jgi:hypothetical protein